MQFNVTLAGESEKLVQKLRAEYNLSDDDIFGKALGLLKLVSEGRLAVVSPRTNTETEMVEYTIDTILLVK